MHSIVWTPRTTLLHAPCSSRTLATSSLNAIRSLRCHTACEAWSPMQASQQLAALRALEVQRAEPRFLDPFAEALAVSAAGTHTNMHVEQHLDSVQVRQQGFL